MLHTVNKSPYEKNTLASCLRLACEKSDILLIEDGVYACVFGGEFSQIMEKALEKHRIYVLEPDLLARGVSISNVIAGIEIVDYEGFVTLTVENDSVHAWL